MWKPSDALVLLESGVKQPRPKKDVITRASGFKIWLVRQSKPPKSAKVIDEEENLEWKLEEVEEEYQLQQWDLSSYH